MTKYFGKIHKPYLLIGGGVGLLAAVCFRLTVGSPLPVLALLGAAELLPPLWLMGLLWLFVYCLAGAAAGYALACATHGKTRGEPCWRGLTFLVIEVTFSFAWYSLLFHSLLPLPSLLCLILTVGAGVICCLSWVAVNPLPAVAVGSITVWFLYLLLIQLAVILHN